MNVDRSVSGRADEVRELRRRLAEAEQTIDALLDGEIDTLRQGDGANGGPLFLYQAQAALRVSEAQYRTLFENTPLPVLIHERGTSQILAVNPAAVAHYGWSEEEFTALSAADIRPPEDVEAFVRFMETAPLHRRDAGVWRHRRADGSDFLASIVTEAIDFQGRPARMSIIRDVTEEVRTEEAVRKSEERFRALVERSSEVVFVLDAEGRTIYISPAVEAVLGYTVEEHLHDFLPFERIHPDERERLREGFFEAVGQPGATETAAFRYLHKDGHWRHVEASVVNRLDDPAVEGFVVNLRDTTDRQRAQEQFNQFFALSVDMLVIMDTEGTFQHVNPAFERALGYPRDRVVGTSYREILHPDDQEAAVEALERLAEGRPLIHFENRYRHADGGWRWISWNVGPPVDGLLYCVARDVTDRRELEEQLLQSQKMEAVGRLAGGVAHDFNNLLTVMLGGTQLLIEDLEAHHPAQDDLREIAEAARRASALTRQLLAFSRKQVMQPCALDLKGLVSGMEAMLRRVIGEDIRLEVRPFEGPCQVWADPGQVEQVLLNLVVNARDAMVDGGRLSIETGRVRVDPELAERHPGAAPGDYVLVRVADTGTGMSREVQERIFEPFFTTKERGKGTGLGLSTVFGIVQQHGGFVDVESEPGRGTVVSICIPEHAGEVPDRPIEVPPSDLRGAETILIVEDDDGVRRFARRVLARRGYQILEAAHGEAALRLAAQHSGGLDLVLTDVVMPGMNGVELVGRMRRAVPGLRALYMSGYGDDAIGARGVLEPGEELIDKPLTIHLLARRVREVLDRAAGG